MSLATLPYTGSLLLLFFFTCLFVGCSAQETRKVALLPAPEGDQVAELSQRVKDQAAEIERLTAKLEGMNSGLEPESETPLPKKLPLLKLKPGGEPPTSRVASFSEAPMGEEALEEKDSEPGEHTVADSRFEAMQLYYRALAQMKNLDYSGALASLREFLNLAPEHVYADRVQYWIADIHFATKEYSLAVVTANVLTSRYPNSFRVPDGLFKRALALEAMGQKPEARETLQELLKRYPSAAIYEDASRRLAELTVEMKKDKTSSVSNP